MANHLTVSDKLDKCLNFIYRNTLRLGLREEKNTIYVLVLDGGRKNFFTGTIAWLLICALAKTVGYLWN